MRATFHRTAALATLLLATPALAHDYELGDLAVSHPYIVESTGKTAAGYFAITNTGTTTDSLVAIRSALPRSEVHQTTTDAQGVARMAPMAELALPPGATVTLEPGGMHVMFMGLDHPLAAGDHLAATLVFAKAGELPVDFHVEARKGADTEADGGDAGMSHMPGMSH